MSKPQTQQIELEPINFFTKTAESEKQLCFFHSQTKDGWQTIIAWNPHKIKSYKIGDRTKTPVPKNQNNQITLGYISYDFLQETYRRHLKAKDDLKLPDVYFYTYKNWLSFDKEGECTIHFQDKSFPKEVQEIESRLCNKPQLYNSTNFQPEISKSKYNRSYQKIKEHIIAGDIYQANLTHRLKATTNIPPRILFTKVIQTNHVEHLAYIEGTNKDGSRFEILSASPERFVKIDAKGQAETCPIKGTRPRGKTPEEDEKMKQELIESEKEAAELNMITDLLRNDLGEVAKIGTVKVEANRSISECPTVWHTYSKITAQIDPKYSHMEAIIKMLPGGSITGCPKKRATEIIDDLEPTARGIYTGIICQILPDGVVDSSIAIRTIIKKDQNLYLQVGGGIVIDSTQEAESEETLQKAQSFMNLL